jgi:hypothetical protein
MGHPEVVAQAFFKIDSLLLATIKDGYGAKTVDVNRWPAWLGP